MVYITPVAYKIALPNILHIVELLFEIFAGQAFILTSVELPIVFTAKQLVPSVNVANCCAPVDKVGLPFEKLAGNAVPIPFVIGDGVITLKLPTELD